MLVVTYRVSIERLYKQTRQSEMGIKRLKGVPGGILTDFFNCFLNLLVLIHKKCRERERPCLGGDLDWDGNAHEFSVGVVEAQLNGDSQLGVALLNRELEVVQDILLLGQGATGAVQVVASNRNVSGQRIINPDAQNSSLDLGAE